MRTLIDLPEDAIEKLDALGEREKRSRASMIREAVAEYLAQRQSSSTTAFGLWGKRKIDGLDYEKKVRAEW